MSLLKQFEAHMGDCDQCRAVIESFFNEEAHCPHHLCETGREVLLYFMNQDDPPQKERTPCRVCGSLKLKP